MNTADDTERHGLLVCPDHDTVLYTLAGIANRDLGWGIAGETWAVMDQLGVYGEETWFRLGDRDLATHIVRTARLRGGARLTEVALHLPGVARRRRPGSCRWPTRPCGRASSSTTAGSTSRTTSSACARSPRCST